MVYSEADAGPGAEAGAGFRDYKNSFGSICVAASRCGRVLFEAEFTSTRRWALALRPEHHPRSDQSGHVEQPACRTRCPKEPHAQRSWQAGTFSGQLTASAVGGSATRSVVADSLRRRAAPLRRAIARAPRLVLASLGPRRHPRGKSVKVPPIISKSGLWPDGARYDALRGSGDAF